MIDLSVLDLAYVQEGSAPSRALVDMIDLARLADALGYRRFWVAEHHNMASIASSAPEVILARLGAATRAIHIGAGGVMLPNHAPLMVAERFKTLEAFFPGRVDLGLGRAPGTDPITVYALRHHQVADADDDFAQRLEELLVWEADGFQKDHPFAKVRPQPADAPLPPIFLLGSSDFSARLAAETGLGFAFAHHFSTYDAAAVMQAYRRRFKPSRWRRTPHAILAVAAIAADTMQDAERLAGAADLAGLRRAHGVIAPFPSVDSAAAHPYTAEDRATVAGNRRRLFVGDGAAVRAAIEPLVAASGANEAMIACPLTEPAARRRCYELLAQAFGLTKRW